MTTIPDLEPAGRQLITLAAGVADDMLQAPTPCGDYTVADLLAHAMGLTIAFRDAADNKGSPAQDAEPGRVALDPGWREALPGRLLAMATAWHSPQAWEGLTKVGGGTMPATIAGQAGLNELVIHGWDLARGPASRTASMRPARRPRWSSSGSRRRRPNPGSAARSARPSRSHPVPRRSTAPSPSAAVTRAGPASFAITAGHDGHRVRKYGYG
jgi:uncharacterized protein (TIGR03086 family)